MTYHLKDFFDARVVERIAEQIAGAYMAFPRQRFVREANSGLATLELMDRGRHIMRALKSTLPQDPAEAIVMLERSLGAPLEASEGNGMEPFIYLPHVLFVAEHGLECFEVSMRAQHALTQRFSAEFSIRRFLERYPERTLRQLAKWTGDPSEHVRRLVSEGTRPRLPWAGRLRAFQQDPTPVLALLEALKDDPHEYVRRSVANNLNDIGKDHPALLVKVARRWLINASPERRRLVEHALRTAVRRGEPEALDVLGFRAAADLALGAVRITPSSPRIGGHVRVDVEVENRGRRVAAAVVNLGIHFIKARGTAGLKVFTLRRVRLEPGESAALGKRISLAQQTTRTHYPGRHEVDVRINGRAVSAGHFTLRA